jgi:hypothetical protein
LATSEEAVKLAVALKSIDHFRVITLDGVDSLQASGVAVKEARKFAPDTGYSWPDSSSSDYLVSSY